MELQNYRYSIDAGEQPSIGQLDVRGKSQLKSGCLEDDEAESVYAKYCKAVRKQTKSRKPNLIKWVSISIIEYNKNPIPNRLNHIKSHLAKWNGITFQIT